MKKFAVVLAGCGVYDGAEIHEAVLTLLAIDNKGGHYDIFAPDVKQLHVINHATGEIMNQERNVLIEAARIARGKIKDLKDFDASDYDAIVFPGGFGVAKNLCSFAVEGSNCSVLHQVETAVTEMHRLHKPIGAMCISPVMIANVIKGSTVTIGNDAMTMDAIAEMGSIAKAADCHQVIVDSKNKIATTPCYMLDVSVKQIAEGTQNLINELYLLF